MGALIRPKTHAGCALGCVLAALVTLDTVTSILFLLHVVYMHLLSYTLK